MNSSLTPQQAQLVSLHSSGVSNSEAARQIGISRQTVITWLKLPQIKNAVKQAQEAQVDAIVDSQGEIYREIVEVMQTTRLSSCRDYLPDAIETIALILKDPESRNTDRLKAAELIFKWVELGNTTKQTMESTIDPSKLTEKEILNELSRIATIGAT